MEFVLTNNRIRRGAALALAVLMILAGAAPAAAAVKPMYQIESPVALLMDADTGQILYEKNMETTMYPASITKIMTALLTLENCSPDEVVTMSYDATHSLEWGASHIALDTDEVIPVEDALYALMLPSANDAANGLAEHVGGSMEGFAQMMNDRARELGAVNTNFANAHGLHEEDHYTCAHDIALIARAAVQHPEFCTIWGTEQKDIPPTNKNIERHLWTQVKMLNDGEFRYEYCTGGKMGWTPQAQNTGVIMAEKNGLRLLCVIMGDELPGTLFNDAEYLFEYGFENLTRRELGPPELVREGILGYGEDGRPTGEMSYECRAGFLLGAGAEPEDVQVEWILPEKPLLGSSQEGQVILTLPEGTGDGQYTTLGVFPARMGSMEAYSPLGREDAAEDQAEEKTSVWKIVLWVVLGLVGGFALFIGGCCVYIKVRYHLRRKRYLQNKQQRRNRAAAYARRARSAGRYSDHRFK